MFIELLILIVDQFRNLNCPVCEPFPCYNNTTDNMPVFGMEY